MDRDRALRWLVLSLAFVATGLLLPNLRADSIAAGEGWVAIARTDAEASREMLGPLAGRRFAPVPTQAMLFLIDKHDVARYRVSDSIRGNRLLFQRLVEGAYPSLPDADAPLLLLREDDPLSDGCVRVDRARAKDDLGNDTGAILARCE